MLRSRSSTAVAPPGGVERDPAARGLGVGVVEVVDELVERLGEAVDGVGELGRRGAVAAHRGDGAAREHARVADREVELGDGVGVERQPLARPPHGRADRDGLARDVDRVGEVLEVRAGRPRDVERAAGSVGVALAQRRGGLAQGEAEPVAQRVDAFVTPATGSRGSRTCETSSATVPPISASMKRFGVSPCGCSAVATKIADTPAWLTRIVLPPSSSAAPIDERDDEHQHQRAGPERRDDEVGDRDADGDADDELDRPGSSAARAWRASETTAEIGAKNGESLTCWAMSHAAPDGDRRLRDRPEAGAQPARAPADLPRRSSGRRAVA